MEFENMPAGIEAYSDSTLEANRADDVYSAGVFSSRPNVHVGDGVFAVNYALPGYAQRENLMGRSEVIDRQTGDNIEVYVGGATSAVQYMPSTQPRYPWPDRDGYLNNLVSMADQQDALAYPSQDISDMPADFLGPVIDGTLRPGPGGSFVVPRSAPMQPRSLSGVLDEASPVVKVVGAVAAGVILGMILKKVI